MIDRKFKSDVTRCPLAVVCGVDACPSVPVFILEVERIFGFVVVNLHIVGLHAALVACNVKQIERETIISVSRNFVGDRTRIALISATVRFCLSVDEVVPERTQIAVSNRIDACGFHRRIIGKLRNTDTVECGKAVRSVDGIEPNIWRESRVGVVFGDIDFCFCRNIVLAIPHTEFCRICRNIIVCRNNRSAVCAAIRIYEVDTRHVNPRRRRRSAIVRDGGGNATVVGHIQHNDNTTSVCFCNLCITYGHELAVVVFGCNCFCF